MGVVAPTAADQRDALVDLYIATNGNSWGQNAGWRDYASGSDPCDNTWNQVSCDGSSGSPNRNVQYVDCALLSTGWWQYDGCLRFLTVLSCGCRCRSACKLADAVTLCVCLFVFRFVYHATSGRMWWCMLLRAAAALCSCMSLCVRLCVNATVRIAVSGSGWWCVRCRVVVRFFAFRYAAVC
jgi:hypothetical protein